MSGLHEEFLRWDGAPMHKWHHYFRVYERLLGRYRHRPLSLLEIGVDRGGSLQLWRRWFGPQAHIAGCDINPACAALGEQGFAIFIGNQADPDFLRTVLAALPPLDVVIDDGGHTASQQITAFETIYPAMKDDGTYIVEDTHTSYWPAFQDRADGLTFMQYAKARCDELNAWHRDPVSFARYGLPPGQRQGTVAVSAFTRSTLSMSFHDSMVAFQRGPVGEPWREERGRAGA